MSAGSLCARDILLRLTGRFFRRGLAFVLILLGTLWAQTVAPDGTQDNVLPSPCASLAVGTPHADALRKVCEYAVSLPTRIPDFTCEQHTARYLDGEASDVVTAEVSYLDGKESYRNIKSNGQPVTDVARLNSHTWSTGQFGADIRGLFDGNKVTFELDNASGDRATLVFHYAIEQQDVPVWRIHMWGKVATPPYHGELRIDKKTGELRQLQIATTRLPEDFPLHSADLLIDYGEVPFGDGTSFLLPLRTVVNALTRGGRKNRNVLEFHNCHKFRATARILPQSDTQSSPPDRM